MERNYRVIGAAFAAVLLTALIAANHCNAEERAIVIKGATGMADLLDGWAKEFMEANPRSKVVLAPGGMEKALPELAQKSADVVMAVRKLTPAEKAEFSSKGMQLAETPVGMDAITILVNASNPVDELTIAQLKKVFTGEYTSWSQLKGDGSSITLVTRPLKNCGTAKFLQDKFFDKAPFASNVRESGLFREIETTVARIPEAIGYCPLAKLEQNHKVKTLAIKTDENRPPVRPSNETVADQTYPLVRPLLLYSDAAAESNIKAFVQFCRDKANEPGVGHSKN